MIQTVKSRLSVVSAAAGLAALAALTGAGSPAAAQTLPEAVRMALQTNPALAAQRAQIEALGERRVQAAAQRRMSVAGDASISAQRVWSRGRNSVTGNPTDITGQSTEPGSIGLSASQPLWLAGRVEAAMSLADAQIAQADARLASAEIGVMQGVIAAYADLRRDLEGVAIRNQNAQALSRQLEAARARFEVGELTRTDVAQVEARLAGARTAIAAAQARADASRNVIERLIGQPPSDLRPVAQPLPVPASLDDALASARAGSPDIAAARLGEQISRASARVIETEFRPRATLSTNLGGQVDQGFDGAAGYNAGITARVTVPLYTGGVGRSRMREALGNANAARLSAVDIERQIVERTSNAWRQLETAQAAIASTQEQLNAARIAFEGVELEQSVGLRTTLDVLIQQQELLEAELARSGAERDLYVARASLAAATAILRPDVFEGARPAVPSVAIPPALIAEEPLIAVSRGLDRALALPMLTERGMTTVRGD